MREKLIDAAYRDYRSTGDLSMRRLADSLGVSAPALYHHFAGKRQLLDQVAERAFVEFGSRLRTGELDRPDDVIRHILGGYRDFAREEPHLFRLLFIEPRPTARRFPRDFANHRSAVFNDLWKAMHEWIGKDPGSADDALYLAHDLWALAHGLILLWRAGRFEDEEAFARVIARSIDSFLERIEG